MLVRRKILGASPLLKVTYFKNSENNNNNNKIQLSICKLTGVMCCPNKMMINKVLKYCDYLSLCRIAFKDFHKEIFSKLGVVEFISTNTGDV